MQRSAALARLATRPRFDLAVIGGGASGAGIALDAASRGLDVLLVERGDFGHGTSSRSSKLIHGGVRYLARGEFGLVREALRERGALLQRAPALVRPLSFLVPVAHAWERAWYGLGLALYDRLAGTPAEQSSRFVAARDLARLAPGLASAGWHGALRYTDARFDDCRLLLALLRAAVNHGATVLNHAEVVALAQGGDGRVRGLVVTDRRSGLETEIAARVVINAAGAWGEAVRGLERGAPSGRLRPSQGAHLVVPGDCFPGEHALVLPKTDDGRIMFVLPWYGRVLLGTTDTALDTVPDTVAPTVREVDDILATAARYLARAPTRAEVTSAFAGVRPLVAAPGAAPTARLSREHAIDLSAGGLLTVSGGKWTTYRLIAEQAVDTAARHASLACGRSRTDTLPLVDVDGAAAARLAVEDPALAVYLHPDLPWRDADVHQAACHGMALDVADVLAYRTRVAFVDADLAIDLVPRVAACMAAALGQGPGWVAAQCNDAQVRLAAYRLTPTPVPGRPGSH